MTRAPVEIRVFDLSNGACRTWSPIVLGRRLNGIWHTGVMIYGYEYFFGGGIIKMRPRAVDETYDMSLYTVHFLGFTEISKSELEKYLVSIDKLFQSDSYDLTTWNCNHFADHICKFLLGKGIPDYILDLPKEVEKSLMGKLILAIIKSQMDAPPISVEDKDHPKYRIKAKEEEQIRRLRRKSCPGDISPRKPTRVRVRRTSDDSPNCGDRREDPFVVFRPTAKKVSLDVEVLDEAKPFGPSPLADAVVSTVPENKPRRHRRRSAKA
ncbi:MAG: hypothetical protein KVP17_003164 [Porospora cf. gigantea B]|uniref:uncharacterized protein n=1 Tax=Porospora cf. gigantea B TaxID=2853592 RepID=UPI003571865F|nr:MAG: hypothetical protein KVP17_003164 [Porospora cf. gigantea B]